MHIPIIVLTVLQKKITLKIPFKGLQFQGQKIIT